LTQTVTNVTFIFGTSPNAKPEKKKWGDMAYYIPPPEKVGGHSILYTPHLKKWGRHVPCVPQQIAPMAVTTIRHCVVHGQHRTWATEGGTKRALKHPGNLQEHREIIITRKPEVTSPNPNN